MIIQNLIEQHYKMNLFYSFLICYHMFFCIAISLFLDETVLQHPSQQGNGNDIVLW